MFTEICSFSRRQASFASPSLISPAAKCKTVRPPCIKRKVVTLNKALIDARYTKMAYYRISKLTAESQSLIALASHKKGHCFKN